MQKKVWHFINVKLCCRYNLSSAECVFWNSTLQTWDTRGCRYFKTFNSLWLYSLPCLLLAGAEHSLLPIGWCLAYLASYWLTKVLLFFDWLKSSLGWWTIQYPSPPARSYRLAIVLLFLDWLKGLWHEIFYLWFIHQTTPPRPLIHELKPFWIWLWIRKENGLRNHRFCAQQCQWHRCDQKRSLVNTHIFCVKVIDVV
jgi:hypothetical protein